VRLRCSVCAFSCLLAFGLAACGGSTRPKPKVGFGATPISISALKRAFAAHGLQLLPLFAAKANREYEGLSPSHPLEVFTLAIFHDELTAENYPFAPQPGTSAARIANVIIWVPRNAPPRLKREAAGIASDLQRRTKTA
jgi:hypothetical protein